MRNVLIDTDPGVDDALALIMVFSSCELELEGLTTVVGNVSLEQGSINALKLIDFLMLRVSLFQLELLNHCLE